MSKKCVAFSKSKLGLEKADNRKAFYAGWDAAVLAEREACAKVCEEVDNNMEPWKRNPVNCAIAIRERSNHG